MTFDPILADIRFGYGRAPAIAPPQDTDTILTGLTVPDRMADQFPIENFDTFRLRMQARDMLAKSERRTRGTPEGEALRTQIRQLLKAARQAQMQWLAASVMRRARSATPFRERLESFWADHFTAIGKGGMILRGVSPYIESAIRPYIAARFEDLLIAAVTHPLMLHYLDQVRSAGPGSRAVRRRPRLLGLNENLAREVLELHTLGVDGPYSQTDVRELAELFTGLTMNSDEGRVFRKAWAEPGAETVLGRSYGGGKNASFSDIEAVLRDLARHPATARHIAGKLAVHFVSDTPDPDLVATIEAAWLESGGELPRIYAALLNHPKAWAPERTNVKPPFDFICSACRALDPDPAALIGEKEAALRFRLYIPMRQMGQIWQSPPGPDGWEEADSAWITPQGLAARLQWALAMPRILTKPLPDPRAFLETTLGSQVPESLRFAAGAAETRSDGVGLILASPAFQRR